MEFKKKWGNMMSLKWIEIKVGKIKMKMPTMNQSEIVGRFDFPNIQITNNFDLWRRAMVLWLRQVTHNQEVGSNHACIC